MKNMFVRGDTLVIGNLIDLVDKFFYREYEKVVICDMDKREHYEMQNMSLHDLEGYDIKKIDGIVFNEGKIWIKF